MIDLTSNTNESKKTIQDVWITLTAAYYNKTVELDYLCNIHSTNSQYSNSSGYIAMAVESISNAMLVIAHVPQHLNLTLTEEVRKMHAKLQLKINGVGRLESRESSSKSKRRMFSPHSNNVMVEAYSNNAIRAVETMKQTNDTSDFLKFVDSTPKSLDSKHHMYYSNNDQTQQVMRRRRLNVTEQKGNWTELVTSYSPIRSDASNSDSFNIAPSTEVHKHPYFNLRHNPRRVKNMFISHSKQSVAPKPKIIFRNFPIVQKASDNPKTSFEWQPPVPKSKDVTTQMAFLNERKSVPDRYYWEGSVL